MCIFLPVRKRAPRPGSSSCMKCRPSNKRKQRRFDASYAASMHADDDDDDDEGEDASDASLQHQQPRNSIIYGAHV